MNGIEAIIAGFIQGTIEWLPISSEAQTMLFMLNQLNMDPQTALSYAFYLHVGTMFAVVIKFKNEFYSVLKNFSINHKMTRILIFATIFTGFTALPLYFALKMVSFENSAATFTLLIGLMLIFTGLIMKKTGAFGDKDTQNLSDKDIVILGMAQGFAIIPGISRSGVTVATLLARNVKQESALVISFLISVPATICIFCVDIDSIRLIPPGTMFLLTVSSFVFGYISMDFLLKFARKTPFWIFCIFLGLVTVVFVLIGYI
ncbi:undecaprenyl-diphosphate phosphatase [Methanoplanus sp. FWC-SCC4]|uniref:Undecaprenyl-diphosphatase n=1 Tax=Methanochimaera problematica TaxID=2609417 RepID=A0AA97FDM8_9EURY|nr:undecaprenyl-diphosphate phosphatase [Methanoplanus sp. FWC-SCC4]WOF16338.1 undecaprenyl-diphosphate phosphatase [Methanoplanus sp. FWC-SCC4]